MLKLARETLSTFTVVTTLAADMKDLSAVGDQTVDMYVSTFALHHLTNPEKLTALREARRILKPHGAIAIADEVISNRQLPADPGALLRRVAEMFYPSSSFEEVESTLRDLKEYPTGLEEMNDICSAAGFKIDWIVYCDIAALCCGTATDDPQGLCA